MRKRQRPQTLEEIKKEWEARLKASGFQDIEEEIAGTRVLKQRAGYAYREQTARETREAKLTYFMLLSQHFEEEQHFEDESDALIMQRITEGVKLIDISKELRRLGLRKHNRDTIRYVQRRYEHKWGIKIWQPFQMVSRRVTKS